MIRIRALIFIIFTAAIAVAGVCAEDLCYEKADAALSRMNTWSDLHAWYEAHLICDDGYLAEGLSEFVTATLAKHWDNIDDLQVEITRNSKFEAFVLKHINASVDGNNLEMIIQNAGKICPPSLGALCDEIDDSAQSALMEMNKN